MKNINIIQVNGEYWVVRADTKRFGKQEIMFEGTYDECFAYAMQNTFANPAAEQCTVYLTGERYGTTYNRHWVTVHRNGFIEQDWSKVGGIA